jgi:hypothetical protein
MSKILANGGDKEKRRALDFYPTPPEVTVALCEFLKREIAPAMRHNGCHEPACGEGHMSKVLEKYFKKVYSTDIRDTGFGSVLDFLEATPVGWDARVCITNPPFDRSEEFIRKAVKEYSVTAMLLKSQYWHAAKRQKLFEETKPAYVLPLTWRPDFLFDTRGEKKAAPTMEVLWTVWVRGYVGHAKYIPLSKP